MSDYSEWSVYEINSAILTLKVKAMGYKPRIDLAKDGCSARCLNTLTEFDYNNPADAWPVIVDNEITLFAPRHLIHELQVEGMWGAQHFKVNHPKLVTDKNPLRAAMIVFLMMKESEQ